MPRKSTAAPTDVFEELRSDVGTEDTTSSGRTKNQVERNRVVQVMNSTLGHLVYRSPKTGAEWRFDEYGTIDEMEVSELLTMRSSYPKFLNDPWLIVLDEEVSDYLGLKSLYKTILTPKQVERLFAMPESKMKQVLQSLPNGMRVLVVQKANEMLANGQLDSLAKRRLIEETYKVRLND